MQPKLHPKSCVRTVRAPGPEGSDRREERRRQLGRPGARDADAWRAAPGSEGSQLPLEALVGTPAEMPAGGLRGGELEPRLDLSAQK